MLRLKRTVSFLLVLTMLAGMLPVQAFAQEAEETVAVETTLPEAETSLPAETEAEATVPVTEIPVTEEITLPVTEVPVTEEVTVPETEVPVTEDVTIPVTEEETVPETEVSPTEAETLPETEPSEPETEPTEETLPEVSQEQAYASSGSCGDALTWTLSDSGLLTITGDGPMSDAESYNSAPWYSVRTSVKEVVIEEGVTAIGKYAFCGCTSLTSVTIPDSVTSLGYGCFDSCTKLPGVTIPEYVTAIDGAAFSGCTALTEIVIPDSVMAIGYFAFEDCTALTSVTMGSGITTVGTSAFNNCTALTEVRISDVGAWCGILFSNLYSNPLYYAKNLLLDGEPIVNLEIPEGTYDIGSYAFYNCTSIIRVSIPNTVTSIGEGAFYGCSAMRLAYVPASVETIDGASSYNAFPADASICCEAASKPDGWNNYWRATGSYSYGSVTWGVPQEEGYFWSRDVVGQQEVVIPEGTAIIPAFGLGYCPEMTSVTIPASVKTIQKYAFSGADALTEVNISDLSAWCAIDFGFTSTYSSSHPCYYSHSLSLNGDVITDLVITADVTAISDLAFQNCKSLKSVTIPGTVETIGGAFRSCTELTDVTIEQGVATIGAGAFYNCTGLTEVDIPDSVTSIGDSAFESCTGLTGMDIPNSVTAIGSFAFRSCTGLTGLMLPDSVTTIGTCAFAKCTGLKAVYIPDSVTSIPNTYAYQSPFADCTSALKLYCQLESAPSGWGKYWNYYDGSFTLTTNWGIRPEDGAFLCGEAAKSEVVIPDDMTAIPSYAFDGRKDLTSITIGSGITSIGDYAFRNCTGLKEIVIPGNVTSIGNSAFYGCTALERVVFEEGLATIGGFAFYNCVALTELNLPDSLQEIGEWAFRDCSGLTGPLVIPKSMTSIGSDAFYNCSGLTGHLVIPEGVTTIDSAAFYLCKGLTAVTLPTTLTSLGSNAFYGSGMTEAHISDLAAWCRISFGSNSASPAYVTGGLILNGEPLIHMVIPDGITAIPDYAFSYCQNLKSVTIPDSVTSIGTQAFHDCVALGAVYIPKSVTAMASGVFESCGGYVPVLCQADAQPGTWDTEWDSSGYYTTTMLPSWGITREEAEFWCSEAAWAENVVIPEGITRIPAGIFASRSSLTSVTIPSTVTESGKNAFYSCSKLEQVNITDLTAWCGIQFADYSATPMYYADDLLLNGEPITDLVIPEGVTAVNGYAFYGCKSIQSVVIPETVTEIGTYAFRGCSSLTDVDIPGTVTTIGSYAFANCTALRAIYLPEGLTSLGRSIFSNSTALRAVYLPASLTTITTQSYTDSPFNSAPADLLIYCAAASKPTGWGYYWAYYSSSTALNTAMGISAADGVFWTGDSLLADVVIPESISQIPSYAFSNRTDLTSVTIVNPSFNIGSYAFQNCTALTDIQFPSASENGYIGSHAFSGCTGLTCVTFPEGTQYLNIVNYSFSDCTNLTQIRFYCDPPFMDVYVFNGTTATAYYLASNDAWDEDVLEAFQEYCGDNITWVGVCGSGHTPVVESPAVAPTCTSPGLSESAYCSECKLVLSVRELLPATGHTFADGACTGCGLLGGICDDGLSWMLVDGTLTISGTGAMTDYDGPEDTPWYVHASDITQVVIEEGVTSVGDFAFYSYDTLTSVTFPDSLIELGQESFADCSLTSLDLPANLTTIGPYCFEGCSELTEVTIPDNVTSATYGVFSDCEKLVRATIGNGVASLEGTFYSCDNLTSLTIGSGVTKMYRVAAQCPNLTEVRFEGSLPVMEPNEFCKNYYSYSEFDPITAYYPYEDASWTADALHDYGCEIIWVPYRTSQDQSSGTCGDLTWTLDGDGTLWIDGVGAMPDYSTGSPAPWSGLRITSLRIGEGVTAIGDYAFNGCTDLGRIVFLGEVPPTIGANAFAGVLASAEYPVGTEAWAAVVTDSYGGTLVWAPRYRGQGSCGDNATWTLDYCGVLTISGQGEVSYFKQSDRLLCWWYGYSRWINHVVVGKNITDMGDYFWTLTSYDTFSALKTVTVLGTETVCTLPDNEKMPALEAFSVPSGHSQYVTVNGVVYSSDMTQLLLYPRCCQGGTDVTVPGSVTAIAEKAFYSCDRLTSVTIPDSVVTLGARAFYDCDALTAVTLGNGIAAIGEYTFYDCASLTDVNIPYGVTTIGTYAFSGCGLTKVTIPDTVTTIDNYAFLQCGSLSRLTLGNGLEKIGQCVFEDCSSLTSVVIPASVTWIGYQAFYHCTGLQRIYFMGDPPTTEGYMLLLVTANAYYPSGNANWTSDKQHNYGGKLTWAAMCSSHTEIILPAVAPTCTESGLSESSYCSECELELSFREVLPATGHTFADGACTGCGLLGGSCGDNVSWMLENGVLTVSGTGAMTDYDSNTSHPWLLHRKDILEVVIEEGVTAIGSNAFLYCTNLAELRIPDSITIIGSGAFRGCNGLKELAITDNVTTIGNNAFLNCTNLTVLTLGRNVATIGLSAFESSGISELIFPASVTSLGYNALKNSAVSVVRFLGNVPQIYDTTFQGTSVTAYYPYDNASWTRDTLLVYGGNLNWVPYLNGTIQNSGSFGTLIWTLTDNGCLLIEGEGAVPDYSVSSPAPWGKTQVKSLLVGEGVTAIGDYAFNGCSKLATVKFLGEVPAIGANAFSGVIASVEYPAGLAGWDSAAENSYGGSLIWVPYYYAHGSAGDTVTWTLDYAGNLTISGEGVEEAAKDPVTNKDFSRWDSMGERILDLVIGAGITKVSTSISAPNLKKVTLLGTETVLSTFGSLGSLEEFCVPDDHSLYSTRDGILYNKEQTELLRYPGMQGGEPVTAVVIPEGVTSIGGHAFFGLDSLTKVTIPNSVTTVGSYAFAGCKNIPEIAIMGDSVAFNYGVFSGCTGLTAVRFYGNAPSINGSIFAFANTCGITLDAVNTTAYYPASNTTWTSDVLQNYGGTITWVGVCGSGHTVVTDEAVEPTCTTDGLTEGSHCSECLLVFVAQEVIPGGHTPTTDEAIPPTCTEEGFTEGSHCDVCGEILTPQEVIPASHTVITDEALAATCSKPGLTEGSHCSACGEVFTAQQEIPAIGHNFQSGTCANCGATTGSCGDDLTWILDSGILTVSGIGTMKTYTLGGAPWYANRSTITAVVIGPEVTSVGNYAFAYCTSLRTITFLGPQPAIGTNAFYKVTAEAFFSGDWSSDALQNYGGTITWTDPCGGNHTVVIDAAVAATCTETGLTEGSHCLSCGMTLSKQTVTEALGHDLSGWNTVTAPTCTETGTQERGCSRCDYTETQTVSATGHDYESTVTVPGCESQGYTSHLCLVCGDSYVNGYTDPLGHDLGSWETVTPATCTEKGLQRRDCSRCDHYETGVLEIIDHSYTADVTEPTCETGGHTTYTCSVCGHSYTGSQTEALGHDLSIVTTITAATCTTAGRESRECSRCGYYEYVSVNATGHSYNSVVTEAGCETAGFTTHTCSTCGHSYTDSNIAALGHNMGSWNTVTEATCTANGSSRRDCSRCDHYETQVIQAPGHSEQILSAKAPTCTETGLTEGKKCSTCGLVLQAQDVLSALGHNMGDWFISTAATCVTNGVRRQDCARCDHFVTEIIQATGHSQQVLPAVAPTCTESGLTEGLRCTVCSAVLTAQKTVAALGHSYGSWSVVTQVTCTTNGSQRRDCSRCGNSETKTIQALGHSEKILPAVAATCTESGLTEGKICTVCNVTLTAQKTVPATGHKETVLPYVAPTCTESGLTEGKTCSACGHSILAQQVLPATGHTEVTLPASAPTCTESGLTEGTQCSVCQQILVAQEVLEARGHDFVDYICQTCGSYAATNGTLGDSVTWDVDTRTGQLIFSGTGDLEPTDTAPWAGYEDSVTEIIIGDGVTGIGSGLFDGLDQLETVTIPETVTDIDPDVFDGCGSLTEILVSDSNPIYADQDGVLFDKELTELIAYPAGREDTAYTVPETVTAIRDNAFSGNDSLEELTFTGPMPELADNAFKGLTATVFYPGEDPSWEPEKLLSYGGNITWVPQYDHQEVISITSDRQTLSQGQQAVLTARLNMDQGAQILWEVTQGSEYVQFTSQGTTATVTAGAITETVAVTVTARTAGGMAPAASITIALVPQAQSLSILREDGTDVTESTVWWDLNSDTTEMTFTVQTTPADASSSVTWSFSDPSGFYAQYGTDDDTVTVSSPSGETGTVYITAAAEDGSGLIAQFAVKFIALQTDTDAPGTDFPETEDPADIWMLSEKSRNLTVYDAETGKPLTSKQITWSMDDIYAPFAKLDAKGKLTAKKVLEKVRVEAVGTIVGGGGTTVTITADIYPAAASLEVLCDDVPVANNQTILLDHNAEPLVLTANIYPLDAMQDVTWTISDKKDAFASYETDGASLTVAPKAGAKAGAVTIKVTANDGSKKTATVKLQFAAYAQSVSIDRSITELTVGDKAVQLTARVSPEAVTKPGLVWSLKDPADKVYANLSSSGKIAPKNVLAPVDVTIVATSKDGMASDEHTITIRPKSEQQLVLMDSAGNYVTKTTQVLDVNRKASITLRACTYGHSGTVKVDWSPLSNKAADIIPNTDGTLTVRMTAPGSINITAIAADGRKATVTVKGVKLASSVEISQKKTGITDGLELASGKSLDLQAALTGAAANKVTWSIVSGSAWASIANSGKLTAAKDLTTAQTVVVRATAEGGAYDEMEILVRPIARGVQVYSESGGRMLFSFRSRDWWVRSNTTLVWDASTQSDTILLNARVYPYYGEDDAKNAAQAVTWQSSTPKVARIETDSEGNVRLICTGTGSTTITVTAADGSKEKVSFKLNIVRSITSLSLEDQVLSGGKKLDLSKLITINPDSATSKKLSWQILEGAEYATLTSAGALTAKKVTQRCQVRVRAVPAENALEGVYAECTVTIYPTATKVAIFDNGYDATGQVGTITIRSGSNSASWPLQAVVYPFSDDGNDLNDASQKVIWTSSNTSYAEVRDGTVILKRAGAGKTVTITATAADGSGKKATVKIRILAQ